MSFLLGLLPDLLQWAPHILGGVGLAGTVAGFIPGLQKYALIGLAVVAVGGIGYGLIERGNYQSEKAARATDRANAESAARKAEQHAQTVSDELIIAQAAAMAVTERTVTVYRDRIANAPKTSTCGPAVRDAGRGVLDLLTPGAGPPDAGGKPAAALPGAAAGAKP